MNINHHFQKQISRKKFLDFLGRGASVLAVSPALSLFQACRGKSKNEKAREILKFSPLDPNNEDKLVLAQGFESEVLIRWGDPIGKGKKFGFNNDYLAFFPLNKKDKKDQGLLWVNHEYADPLFIHGRSIPRAAKKKAQVDLEQEEVGGSIVYIEKNKNTSKWGYVKNHPSNRRIHGKTKIPLIADRPIEGSKTAMGTLGNCAGGITPWNTVLTCEENYEDFYGDHQIENTRTRGAGEKDKTIRKQTLQSTYFWDDHYKNPSEHYGWVVEVDPLTGQAKKLTALGRFCHECATTLQAKGRVAVYMGDDTNDQCLYKFISDTPHSLEKGELFVANTEKGEWISLSYQKNKKIQEHFKDQTEALTYTRKAAHLMGGTPLDRPEDIEIDPKTGSLIVSLTNNRRKQVHHGSLLKIEEENHDPLSLRFKASTFLTGGETSGFSCPDNMVFDPQGNLWFATDISGKSINKGVYRPFKNNGLFYVPLEGSLAGEVFQVASAPIGAELTGLMFLPDHTLLMSVQHPGEYTKNIRKPTSRWPDYGDELPKSAVVAIRGEAMTK